MSLVLMTLTVMFGKECLPCKVADLMHTVRFLELSHPLNHFFSVSNTECIIIKHCALFYNLACYLNQDVFLKFSRK